MAGPAGRGAFPERRAPAFGKDGFVPWRLRIQSHPQALSDREEGHGLRASVHVVPTKLRIAIWRCATLYHPAGEILPRQRASSFGI